MNKARKLFEKQANALVSCGMPRADTNKPLDVQTTAGASFKSNVRTPVLGAGDEDQDPENYEANFEQKYEGEIPQGIVGLMFEDRTVRTKDALNNDVEVELWEKVLMDLSSKLLTEGVETTRQLASLEKAERFAAGNDASSGPMSDEDED